MVKYFIYMFIIHSRTHDDIIGIDWIYCRQTKMKKSVWIIIAVVDGNFWGGGGWKEEVKMG